MGEYSWYRSWSLDITTLQKSSQLVQRQSFRIWLNAFVMKWVFSYFHSIHRAPTLASWSLKYQAWLSDVLWSSTLPEYLGVITGRVSLHSSLLLVCTGALWHSAGTVDTSGQRWWPSQPRGETEGLNNNETANGRACQVALKCHFQTVNGHITEGVAMDAMSGK